jgi:hypothetical protein
VSGAKSGLSPSETSEALAARQREHRLRERMKPKHPLAANADPWLVVDQALDALERIRPELRAGGQACRELELAAELLRQLGWGPED